VSTLSLYLKVISEYDKIKMTNYVKPPDSFFLIDLTLNQTAHYVEPNITPKGTLKSGENPALSRNGIGELKHPSPIAP